MADEWICNKCGRVYESNLGRCCEVKSEKFDLCKHGRELISGSNSWISVWEKWKDDPLLAEVSGECIKDGCYSCAAIFNIFVEQLKKRAEVPE